MKPKTPLSSNGGFAEGANQVKKLYAQVEVKNIGKVEGKKTVQVYATAPYTRQSKNRSLSSLVSPRPSFDS